MAAASAVLLAACLLAAGPAPAPAQDDPSAEPAAGAPAEPATDSGNPQQVQQSAEELARVRARINEVQQTLQRERASRDELRRAVQTAEQRIHQATTKLRTLRRDIETQKADITRARAEQAKIEAGLVEHRAALAEQVRSAYLVGQQGRTRLMLSQRDPGLLARMMAYYGYMNRARIQRMEAIRSESARLVAIQDRLATEVSSLQALQKLEEENLASLKSGRSERQTAMRQIEGRIEDADRQLSRLSADQKELQQLLDQLRNVLADVPLELETEAAFSTRRGKLPWPARGTLLAHFGAPKAGGALSWNGLWIGAAAGTPVKAVAGGRVAYVCWMHRYGLIVVLEHEGGFFTLYGHNQSAAKTAGEWVRAGEVIAAVGDTGGQERAGLYFELRQGPDPVDPGPWLAN